MSLSKWEKRLRLLSLAEILLSHKQKQHGIRKVWFILLSWFHQRLPTWTSAPFPGHFWRSRWVTTSKRSFTRSSHSGLQALSGSSWSHSCIQTVGFNVFIVVANMWATRRFKEVNIKANPTDHRWIRLTKGHWGEKYFPWHVWTHVINKHWSLWAAYGHTKAWKRLPMRYHR